MVIFIRTSKNRYVRVLGGEMTKEVYKSVLAIMQHYDEFTVEEA